jgi:hypothetical protein
MAVVPPQGNKKILKRIAENYKKYFFRYTIFAILLCEILSLFMVGLDNYATYWYPLLSTNCIFALVFHIFIKSKTFKFCKRKKIAFGFLSLYYFINILYLILRIPDSYFFKVVAGLLLLAVSTILLITFIKKE